MFDKKKRVDELVTRLCPANDTSYLDPTLIKLLEIIVDLEDRVRLLEKLMEGIK